MDTKLAAIYNIWCGDELLKGSVDCIKNHVDLIIFVYQDISNFGERYNPLETILDITPDIKCKWITEKYTPKSYGGMYNEIAKRNLGLEIASQHNCTHFLHMDCDEYWEDFGAAKKEFFNSGALSSVAQMWTFFKKPTLRFANPEGYFVPFITKLDKDMLVGNYPYPFYCDPTRKPSSPQKLWTPENVILIKEKMFHFSYCRTDIMRKIRNSSAKVNIEKSTILRDYTNPDIGAGSYVEFFEQKLISVENIFGIDI